MEPELLRFVGEGGVSAAMVLLLWRLAEKVGQVAEGFAACSAKLDTLISILKRDNQ